MLLIVPVRAYRDALTAAMHSVPELKLVANASSDIEALARIAPLQPSVALLDFGIESVIPLLAALNRIAPTTHIVAFGVGPGQAHAEAVVQAAENGVCGFVDADQSLGDIVGAIHLAVRGQSSCSPRTAALLLQALRRRPGPPLMNHDAFSRSPGGTLLTPREQVVAELAARGMTNRQIAIQLVLGESTVKSHVHAILGKLGLAHRAQIVLGATLGLQSDGVEVEASPPGGAGMEGSPPPVVSTPSP